MSNLLSNLILLHEEKVAFITYYLLLIIVNLILFGVFVFALSIVILSFIDLKLAIAFYISYLILVPYMQFNIAGVPLSYNLVNILLFSIFLYQSQINKRFELNYQFIIPFLFLYFSLFYLSLFSGGMPWSLQFDGWRSSLMKTCLIPFIIWNLALADQKFLIYFKWAFLISITIAGVYGLFLMKMEGMNPYISMLADHFGKKDNALLFAEMKARLNFSTAAKIQSTMGHPMVWTLILCFSLITLWAIYLKTKMKILWFLIVLIGFNILISGVRTGIAALILGFIYILVRYRNFKLIILIFVALTVIYPIVQSNDSLSNLFASFTDTKGKSDVSGSSITMRLNQLQGTFNEIKGSEFTGKGYGWTDYYQYLYGDHPVILAFESLIFSVLCNSGYIGVLIWMIFVLWLFQTNRKILTFKNDVLILDTLVITFLAYAIGTGEYAFMSFFAMFYSFLCAYLTATKDIEINSFNADQKKTHSKVLFLKQDKIPET